MTSPIDKPDLQEQYDRLWAMTVDERITAMRAGRLTYRQLCHWSAQRPDQVPCVCTGDSPTGEFEWIAMFEPSIAEQTDTAASTTELVASSCGQPRPTRS